MSLKDYNKITIPGQPNDITLEVNWSSAEGGEKMVKVNGKDIVSLKDLYMFLMVAGDAEIQDSLMPVRKTEVTHFQKAHNIQLKHDMKKGQMLKIPCLTSVETEVVEGLAGLLKGKEKNKTTSSIILPK